MADSSYPLRLVRRDAEGPPPDPEVLARRPFLTLKGSLTEDAELFEPGEELETAINTSIAVGDPLLLTGEPGTGKTQTAYYVAHKLGLEPVLHFQVKSDVTARDLLYHFDTVRYFHDAHLEGLGELDKRRYRDKRPLWKALASERPRVLLIDEIDKAPRDFPNDLLHELDQMEFEVAETGEKVEGPAPGARWSSSRPTASGACPSPSCGAACTTTSVSTTSWSSAPCAAAARSSPS